MPIYDIQCTKCGNQEEVFIKMSEYDNLPECCSQPMVRMLSAPSVIADNTCYRSQKTGEMITSRTQHKNHLKQHGLIEVGNEKMPEKKVERSTKEKQALRTEIAARLDSSPRK